MITFQFFGHKIPSPEEIIARQKGFEDANEYFVRAIRDFYRDLKKGRLMKMATQGTATNHKCNCEFCFTNEPKKL